jgi:hypothetical protein
LIPSQVKQFLTNRLDPMALDTTNLNAFTDCLAGGYQSVEKDELKRLLKKTHQNSLLH